MKYDNKIVDKELSICNVRVYGLDESIIASSYPFETGIIKDMSWKDIEEKKELQEDKSKKLASCKSGTGHDCWLKGVVVQFDLKMPEFMWREMDRYHFRDYVSSQSKMHSLMKMNIEENCNKFVSPTTIELLNVSIHLYNNYEDELAKEKITLINGEEINLTKENLWRTIISNCPCGYCLGARITTNYLQLKSIYLQRHNHKNVEWRYICDWIKSLPMMDEILKDIK